MYKKSFFRGLGTGLIVGALTVTVAFNFDNAGKNNSDQGNTTKVVQQDTTEDTGSTSETAKTTEAEKNTTEKSTAKDNTKDAAKDTAKDSTKDTAEKASSDTNGSDVNGKGDVYSDGSNGKSTEDGSSAGNGNAGSTAGADDKSGASTGDKTGTSTGDKSGSSTDDKSGSSAGGNNGSSQGGSDLSDNTQKVPSSKDNGYTEDKNSQSGSTEAAEKTTEANTEAPKPSAIKYDNGGGQITIVDGMSAYEICQLLEQIGLRDADEYYDWLLRSGYSDSLVSGTYTFSGNETNGGIVWILLGHQ